MYNPLLFLFLAPCINDIVKSQVGDIKAFETVLTIRVGNYELEC